MELNAELLERLRKVDPATIGHFISGGFMHPRIKPLNPQFRLLGPACTVRLMGKDSAPLYYALKHGKEGSVVVIDRCGDEIYACIGEIVAYCAKKRGFAGMIVDGPITDSVALGKFDFPIFCTGASVVTTNVIGTAGDWDHAVNCAGAVVNPGDIIFGDADGVIVIPPEQVEGVLPRAEAALAREPGVKRIIDETGFFNIDIDKFWEADVMGMINSLKAK
jgi:regulator of RNase E activity RraA